MLYEMRGREVHLPHNQENGVETTHVILLAMPNPRQRRRQSQTILIDHDNKARGGKQRSLYGPHAI